MAQINVTVQVLTNVLLKLGSTDSYEKHVSKAELVPTTPTQTWSGLGGNVEVVAGTPAWVMNLDLAQDWATANSLSSYLLDHTGEKVPFTLEPEEGEDGWTGEVIIVPSSIGGTVNAVAVSSVTLQLVGQPTRVPAV